MSNWLADLIAKTGAIPFSKWMELALYHPEFGYYTSKENIFGTRGDFYTAPGVHSVFAETLAEYVWNCWQETNDQAPLRIIEMGAGNGKLAQGIIRHLTDTYQLSTSQFAYVIVEHSQVLARMQQQTLESWQSYVTWAHTFSEIPPCDSVVLTNEVLDAFPVDIVRKMNDGWMQKWIDWDPSPSAFREVWRELQDMQALEYMETMQAAVNEEKQETFPYEWNRGMPKFVHDVDRVVRSGLVITIDYGGDAEELYGLHHPLGTVRSFFHHQVSNDVLANPGQRDITADVDFSCLERLAQAHGWIRERYETQGRFLVHAGILNRLQDTFRQPYDDAARKRNMAIKHLILPGGMGDAFRVAVHRLPLNRPSSEESACF
ncbi:SAM-dependent methyltransferase [Fodinisporobacter ferrooxydans]|uniref:SAM-dependent methyltransferase n=1 Tax=Fodinisporobacter ferrooxydans TaxID=2901836 RepID=A0ABY4CF38_9BACL|nr:SAM-dependent methyltransferase [Alicyclobacillaceae bacterium MYW30-H2]